jgi:hypothetical protein
MILRKDTFYGYFRFEYVYFNYSKGTEVFSLFLHIILYNTVLEQRPEQGITIYCTSIMQIYEVIFIT